VKGAGNAPGAAGRGTSAALRLGVLVPCRNEAEVLPAKLANLALAEWPAAAGPHRLVVIDNGSTDATAEVAAELVSEHFAERASVEARVVAAPGGGKPAALRAGLAAVADCDLVVVTDADVRLDPAALTELAQAFGAFPDLGLACGAQVFVESLSDDGRLCAAGGGAPREAAGWYDRVTAWVRRFESRSGRLFSVHGQLMAWRTELQLEPRAGLAADDIALRQEARRKGSRVELIPAARFFEVKLPRDLQPGAQAVRRAAAYFQVMRAIEPAPGLADRLQYLAYRYLPEWTPWLVPLVLLAVLVVAGATLGATAVGVLAASMVVGALTPVGRRLFELLWIMERARRLERRQGLADGWEMARS
jgi:glycosyltransferase involved in cell wall biosynthesis